MEHPIEYLQQLPATSCVCCQILDGVMSLRRDPVLRLLILNTLAAWTKALRT